MQTLTAPAPAKINLTLRVGPRRADGFHPLESLVALVGLADTLTVAPRAAGQLVLRCDDPTLPTDARNLVLRAARALAAARGLDAGADLTLAKRIPAGAGLGGGSSDAATTLRLLNELWHCGLETSELAALGATLGSDVPLFFHGPLCVMRGRGEVLEAPPPPMAESLRATWVVLVLPALACSTAAVYAEFDRLPAPPVRPLTELSRRAPQGGAPQPLSALLPLLFNDLEPAALRVCPPLVPLFEHARGALGPHVRMTGSGAALFHLYGSQAEAQAAAARARHQLGTRLEVVPVGM